MLYPFQSILKHPWIVSEAPDVQMGDDYFARIKQLALRQKLKCFFLDSRLEERNQVRRTQLQLLLPFLASSSNAPQTPGKPSKNEVPFSKPLNESDAGSASPTSEVQSLHYANSNPGSSSSLETDGAQIQNKLKHLKHIIIPSLASNYSSDKLSDMDDFTKDMSEEDKELARRITARDDVVDDELSVDTNVNGGEIGGGEIPLRPITPKKNSKKGGSASAAHRIDYDTFLSMMENCGLPELASPSVFKIFDLNHCGE